MNKLELESLLRQARLPEVSSRSSEEFLRRVVDSLKRDTAPPVRPRAFSPIFIWAGALAACALMLFAIGRWHEALQREKLSSVDILTSTKLIHEMVAMFPNRLRAIVEDSNGVNLVLSQDHDLPSFTPLYVRICDGKRCASFVTFSGQEIQVAGQKVTALADGRGGIIVTGSQFVWSSTERIGGGTHLKIEARDLGAPML